MFKQAKPLFYKVFFTVFCSLSLLMALAQEAPYLQDIDSNFFAGTNAKPSKIIIDERKVPDSIINRYKNDDAFWYANTAIEKKEPQKNKDGFSSLFQTAWVRQLFWILFVGCFVALLAWFLASGKLKLFYKKREPALQEPAEDGDKDIFSVSFDEEIKNAKNANNFRLAIRLMYLQVLKILADTNRIQYEADKTNSDYLLQLHTTAYYQEFFKLTRDFEYVWYGRFLISEAVFSKMQDDFTSFINRVTL
jgi:hypothetical protein